jgi:NADH-quinone oxidoreductase subunit L
MSALAATHAAQAVSSVAHAAHAAAAVPLPSTDPWIALIPLLPLVAFVINIFVGRRLGRLSAWVSIAALAGSWLLTMAAAMVVFQGQVLGVRWAWLAVADPMWTMGFRIDGMAWMMLFIVTFIGGLIHIYSAGYMHDDPRFSRFFAYLSLFCASMLCLVLADHFALLFVGWELVGLCSFLLIGFWFEKPSAVAASRKAFLTTRVGDTGLLAGILLLAYHAGDLTFAHLPATAQQLAQTHGVGLLTLISTLVFVGAAGKSAQIPLHVWLPDAMEGPTPVSALIHAATMVAAGVYLVARTFPLFTPQSLAIVLALGLATHLFAGTVALVMTDIKKVLAYSTISQLGLMFTALGLGAVPYAMFHLATHAFFKALLFLGSGSVIHGTHQQDLDHLGGLIDTMRWTALTFLIGALAMGGMFPLAGFWSKDAILLEAQHRAPAVFWLLTAGAVMTTAYVFRLYLRTFHGAPSHHAEHAHESPPVMTIPLVILAVGAAVVGLLGSPFAHGWLVHLIGAHETHEGLDLGMVATSFVILGAGVGLAWLFGVKRTRALVNPLTGGLYAVASNKYFVDELYGAAIVRPFLAWTRWLARFDTTAIDAVVNGAGMLGWALGHAKGLFDRFVIDGLVNAVASVAHEAGTVGRRLQSGVVHHYLLGVVAAVVVLAVWLR